MAVNETASAPAWVQQVRAYCAPRFTAIDIKSSIEQIYDEYDAYDELENYQAETEGTMVEYLHCSGCDEDHAAGYFSRTQQYQPAATRLCIGRQGFIRLCEHKTVHWNDVEQFLLGNDLSRESLIIKCTEFECNRTLTCGHTHGSEFRVELNTPVTNTLPWSRPAAPKPTNSLTWSVHYSTADLHDDEPGKPEEKPKRARER